MTTSTGSPSATRYQSTVVLVVMDHHVQVTHLIDLADEGSLDHLPLPPGEPLALGERARLVRRRRLG